MRPSLPGPPLVPPPRRLRPLLPGLLLPLLLLPALAGCFHGPPRLWVAALTYEDLPCSDQVPFTLEVANRGDRTATGATVTVTADPDDTRVAQEVFRQEGLRVRGGGRVTLEGNLTLSDNCSAPDGYRLDVRATVAKGRDGSRTENATI